MSIPGSASSLFFQTAAADAAAAGPTKSLRFNSGDSAHLSKTYSSASNRKKWTWSAWVKLCSTSTGRSRLFGVSGSNTGSPYNFATNIGLNNNKICFTNHANDIYSTDAVFRDNSAWYHIVVALDTTDATTANRVKIYVNGVLQDKTYGGHGGAAEPSQNTEYAINSTLGPHTLGASPDTSGTAELFFDGYLADVYFIDGSALAPTSFGAFDDNGVWQASTFSGTYGSNGFHLAFSDSTSSAALGTDSSGNSNTFTVNNISGDAVGLSTANQGFGVVTYTGNGGSQSITGVGFQPDFVWIKNRETFTNQVHALFDVVRGRQMLSSDSTNSEANWHGSNSLPYRGYVDSFDSDGFSLAPNSASSLADYVNYNNTDYVAWCWKAGGSASSNTDGTITSSVSANTTYGFSVVGYTGNNTSGATVGHGLSSTPKWIIVKSREQSGQFWHVYHASLDADEYAYLNNSNAVTSGNDFMNGTRPTSSVFTLGNGNGCNKSGDDVIAYCWAEVSGFSKISSYNGSGGAATKVVTGFRPRYIIARPINDSNGNRWHIVDTDRGVGGSAERLFAEDGSVHTARQEVLIENDGFVVTNTTTDSGSLNRNTEYIYAAFASKPSGEDIDSLFDAPTNGTQSDTGAGGEVSGNYCTLNPLDQNGGTLSNGNLDYDLGSGTKFSSGTIAVKSGKWYWEAKAVSGVTNGTVGGRFAISQTPTETHGENGPFTLAWHATAGIQTFINGSGQTRLSGTGYSDGDILGLALDADNNISYWYKNGSLIYTYNFSSLVAAGSQFLAPSCWNGSSGTPVWTYNFGSRPFAYSARSGHKCLVSTNLPTPTIADASDYFDTLLWTGDGASSTREITGLSMENAPDWIWAKERNGGSSYALFDAVRGFGTNNVLKTNSTDTAGGSNGGYINATSTSSITWAQGTSSAEFYDANNKTYVAWCWDAGSSTATNTDGTGTCQLRANPSAGFSIATFTGVGTAKSYGHGLNAAPEMVIVKGINHSDGWSVYHSALGNTKSVALNQTSAAYTSTVWDNTSPSSTVTRVGGDYRNTGNTNLMLSFTSVAGYSAFGEYIGVSSTDGPFIYTGFRVAWLMIKNVTDNGWSWNIYDTTRDSTNANNKLLRPDYAASEISAYAIDFLSNGFKLKHSDGAINQTSKDYIYAAFAENPFQANGGLAR